MSAQAVRALSAPAGSEVVVVEEAVAVVCDLGSEERLDRLGQRHDVALCVGGAEVGCLARFLAVAPSHEDAWLLHMRLCLFVRRRRGRDGTARGQGTGGEPVALGEG